MKWGKTFRCLFNLQKDKGEWMIQEYTISLA